MKKNIRLIDWMICDDIRQEVSGKFIFIGVYDGDITVPVVPITLTQLIFSSKWDTTEAPIKKFEFKLIQPNGKEIGHTFGEQPTLSPETKRRKAVVQIALSPFTIETLGEYKIEAKVNSIDYDTIASFKVILQSPPQTPV